MGEGGDCKDGCEGCRTAVVKAYRALRKSGGNDRFAFEGALHVYALRHPERSPEECLRVASEWIADAVEH